MNFSDIVWLISAVLAVSASASFYIIAWRARKRVDAAIAAGIQKYREEVKNANN